MDSPRAIAGVLAGACLAKLAGGAAYAQSNEAWIGQTGDTNTITIVQRGSNNLAGAEPAGNLLNQNGRFNTISIVQTGWNNAAGASAASTSNAPEGIDQNGDRNQLAITQTGTGETGVNTVGAVAQSSADGLSGTANIATITQIAGDGDGEAGHFVGATVQMNSGGGANVLNLLQSGGSEGLGNRIVSLLQVGAANLAEASQYTRANTLRTLRQTGAFNSVLLSQREGEGNTVEAVVQAGSFNSARIGQAGSRNVAASIFQNNEGIEISGNRVVLTLAGDDNGGDGLGGMGIFRSAVALATNAFQGNLSQIGDDNDARVTLSGGEETQYGIQQDGNGNGAFVTVTTASATGMRSNMNEAAVVQIGDDNQADAQIAGNSNAVGVSMRGERNTANLFQSGSMNATGMLVTGNDNNSGTFSGSMALAAFSARLSPGRFEQVGDLNTARVEIVGDVNLTAAYQEGTGQEIALYVGGSGNQALIVQTGALNNAALQQLGSDNQAVIRQF